MGVWHRWTSHHPTDRPALTWRGTTWTYGELHERVRRAVGLLTAQGVGTGDVVALQLPKSPAFLELHLGALAIGAVTLPISDRYTLREVRFLLHDSGARWAALTAPIAAATAPERPTLPAGAVRAALDDATPRSWPARAPADGAHAVLCYTSGTTGRPKGARITHGNIVAMVEALHGAWRWSCGDVLIHALPVNHVHGLFVAQHGALRAGAHARWMPRFEPGAVLSACAGDGTMFMGVPTYYHRLLQVPALPDLSSMRLFTSGSAPLPATTWRAFAERTGHRILERYGMTEVGIVLSNPWAPEARRPGTVGFPLPGVRARVADPTSDETLPAGEIGEIRIAGPTVCDGYHGLPEQTAAAMAGGEMRTGDLGLRDEEGYFHVVGRRSDMIISGGLNVYPREVEGALLEHPQVLEVAVFGVPDADLGEAVTAAVVVGEGVDAETVAGLRDWLRPHLAPYKLPRRLHRLEALPRNSMGKVTKATLRARFAPATVRAATLDDRVALTEGNVAMALQTEDLELDPEVVGRGVARGLRGEVDARYFVAELAGRVVGQCMVTTEWSDWRDAPVWWLQSVYVHPDARRRGVYRAMHEHVRAAAHAAGAAGLRLYVDQRNTTAMGVYARVGMDGEHYRVFEQMFPGPADEEE